MLAALTVMLCLSIGASGVFRLREANVRREMAMQQQREMADVIAAMADIEVNLSKLLIASGARQSVSLLGETALWLSTWKAACPHGGQRTDGGRRDEICRADGAVFLGFGGAGIGRRHAHRRRRASD